MNRSPSSFIALIVKLHNGQAWLAKYGLERDYTAFNERVILPIRAEWESMPPESRAEWRKIAHFLRQFGSYKLVAYTPNPENQPLPSAAPNRP